MTDRKTSELTFFSISALIIIAIYSVATFQRNSYWADELSLWEDAKLKSPSKSRPYTYSGVAYAKLKVHKEAYSNLAKAIVLNPGDIEARYNLGILYMELGRLDLAEIEFKYTIERRPEIKDSYLALSDLYARSEETEKSARILAKTSKRWPNDIALRLKLATALARSGKLKEAAHVYNWVLKRAPGATEALNGLGNINMLQRRPGLALSYYEAAIEIRPNEPKALYNAALVSEELGKYKLALHYYSLFIKAAKGSRTPYSEAVRNATVRIQYMKKMNLGDTRVNPSTPARKP